MTPQFCIAPAGSRNGDCYRACLASILNLPVREVPNFVEASPGGADGGEAGWDAMFNETRDWLRQRGLGIYRTYCSAGWTLDRVLTWFSADNPSVPLILIGQAGDGSIDNHALVAMDGKIAHDPGRCGLKGPCIGADGKPGWWWMDIIAFADFSTVTA